MPINPLPSDPNDPTYKTLEDIYRKSYQDILDMQSIKDYYSLSTYPQWSTNTSAAPSINTNNVPTYYSNTISTSYPFNHATPQVGAYDSKVEVLLEDGKHETITREELVKYISERKLIQENELVRVLYDRYQVAAKLARSDDNGDTGV